MGIKISLRFLGSHADMKGTRRFPFLKVQRQVMGRPATIQTPTATSSSKRATKAQEDSPLLRHGFGEHERDSDGRGAFAEITSDQESKLTEPFTDNVVPTRPEPVTSDEEGTNLGTPLEKIGMRDFAVSAEESPVPAAYLFPPVVKKKRNRNRKSKGKKVKEQQMSQVEAVSPSRREPSPSALPVRTQSQPAVHSTDLRVQEVSQLPEDRSPDGNDTQSNEEFHEGVYLENITGEAEVRTVTDEEEDDDEDVEESDSPDLSCFQHIMDSIDLETLCNITMSIRRLRLINHGKDPSIVKSCEIHDHPKATKHNLLYLLTCNDDKQFVVRVPIWAHNPKPKHIEMMNAECNTHQYLYPFTDLRIPELILFDTNPATIGAAFILMDFVDGAPLSQCWLDISDAERKMALQFVSKQMASLYGKNQDSTGMLRFDEGGATKPNFTGGPDIQLKPDTGVLGYSTRGIRPFNNCDGYLRNLTQTVAKGSNLSSSTKETICVLLRSIPAYHRNCLISLTYTDVDWHNIMYNPDKQDNPITFTHALNIRSRPVNMGAAACPDFLLKDYNPITHLRDGLAGTLYQADFLEDYRETYLVCFNDAIGKSRDVADITNQNYDPRWTEESLHIKLIETAVDAGGVEADAIVDQLIRRSYARAAKVSPSPTWLDSPSKIIEAAIIGKGVLPWTPKHVKRIAKDVLWQEVVVHPVAEKSDTGVGSNKSITERLYHTNGFDLESQIGVFSAVCHTLTKSSFRAVFGQPDSKRRMWIRKSVILGIDVVLRAVGVILDPIFKRL